jgi:hypothetical protein
VLAVPRPWLETGGAESTGVADESAGGVKLFGAQRPEPFPQAALLAGATADRAQNPTAACCPHNLELHAALMLRDLLPDLTRSHVRHASVWTLGPGDGAVATSRRVSRSYAEYEWSGVRRGLAASSSALRGSEDWALGRVQARGRRRWRSEPP